MHIHLVSFLAIALFRIEEFHHRAVGHCHALIDGVRIEGRPNLESQ